VFLLLSATPETGGAESWLPHCLSPKNPKIQSSKCGLISVSELFEEAKRRRAARIGTLDDDSKPKQTERTYRPAFNAQKCRVFRQIPHLGASEHLPDEESLQ
jgi:hypothetical protein